ncbi:hypothetical protein ACYJ1Y_02590 [Natrialbaceae archaeon A-gly3]
MTESNPHIAVELWVRSFAPTVTGTAHERAIDHLEGSVLSFDEDSADSGVEQGGEGSRHESRR